MFNKLKQLSDLKKMRDQAMKLKKELAQERVEMKEEEIRVVIRADQRIEEIEIRGEPNKKLVKALNKALKKAQKKAASKMMMTGGLSSLLR